MMPTLRVTVRPRIAYASPPQGWKQVRKIADAGSILAAEAFRDAVNAMKRETDDEALEDALRRRDLDAAEAAVGIKAGLTILSAQMGRVFRAVFESTGDLGWMTVVARSRRKARKKAGLEVDEELASKIKSGFNVVNPRAVAWLSNHTERFVEAFGVDQAAGIRDAIGKGFTEGRTPKDTAKAIRRMVGLSGPQRSAVDSMASKMRLRDEDEDDIDRAVAEKTDSYIAARADTIARHETLYAAYAGERESWRQAIEDGAVGPKAIQVWWVTDDDRLCEICEPLHETRAKVDEPFPGGYFQPGDPHVQCRCAIFLEPDGE